jgi:ABC-type phosphate/phosphonate transport system substrate-binding protein
MLIANARMYAVNGSVAAAWRTLLEWVVARADVECEVIDYPAPAPLPELWKRPDLACVFMCGFPLATARPTPWVLAAPVPLPARYGDAPVYCSDIVARADSGLRQLTDLFGRRFAFTAEDSQSGFHAPRRFLAPFARDRGGALFAATVGPLQTPRRIIEAILSDEADAGPLDSYFHDLLRHHEPALAAQLRVLASTPFTPIPALVAAPTLPPAMARRLTSALLAVADADELAPIRDALCLRRFAAVDTQTYASLRFDAHDAATAGYPRIA